MRTTLLSQLVLSTISLCCLTCAVSFGTDSSMVERAKTTSLWRPVTEMDVKSSPESLKNQIPDEWSWQNSDSFLYLRERCADISSRLKALTQINTSATPLITEESKFRAIKQYFDDIDSILDGLPLAPTAFDAMAVRDVINQPGGKDIVSAFRDSLDSFYNKRRVSHDLQLARKTFDNMLVNILNSPTPRSGAAPDKTSISFPSATSIPETDVVTSQEASSLPTSTTAPLANSLYRWWPYALVALLTLGLTLLLRRYRRK